MKSSSDVLFRISQLFFGEGFKAQEIAKQLGQEGIRGLNRQVILPKLIDAYAAGIVRLIPPRHTELERRLSEVFGLERGRLWVINVDDESAKRVEDRWAEVHVAAAAADLVLEQLKRLPRGDGNQPERPPAILLGLGPGRATLEFSQFLSQRLRADPEAPNLRLVAITGGAVPDCPQYAPLSFFNLFPAELLVDESVGLFAEMLVPQETFEKIKDHGVGVREAFEVRDNVDLVVTAMGDFQDEHDLLRRALESANVKLGRDWLGNVQYRPYSKTAPILQSGNELRAVTLFELSDFVEMARDPSKSVVLIARRCGVCGRTKAKAVRPLLAGKKLRVFSHLVMDLATARELLNDEAGGTGGMAAKTERPRDSGSDSEERKAFAFWLCDAFFNRKKTIQEIVTEAAKPLVREKVYQRLAKAGSPKSGLIEVVEPLERNLVERVTAKFHLNEDTVRVVDAGRREGGREVAGAAAELVLELAGKLAGGSDRTIGLGLGPGRATLDFSLHLGRRLREDRKTPLFDLIAISAGSVPEYPKFAPESFFNLFPAHALRSRTGLFAETLVTGKEFRKIVAERRPGVKEALDKRDRNEIDILVTAIGDLQDPDDLLKKLLLHKIDEKELDKTWIGSVQHRPYTKDGPVQDRDDDWRAVTLFELEDLARLANQKGKHVVLIARQCRLCGRTRAPALRPLLTAPNLRVWSELVMDVATARELVRGP